MLLFTVKISENVTLYYAKELLICLFTLNQKQMCETDKIDDIVIKVTKPM